MLDDLELSDKDMKAVEVQDHMPDSYKAAEKKSKECFLPMWMVRRHASVLMANVDETLNACLEKSEEPVGIKNKSTELVEREKMECMINYRKNLSTLVPKVATLYDGYLQNFEVDGSLTKPEHDRKVLAEVEAQMKMVKGQTII